MASNQLNLLNFIGAHEIDQQWKTAKFLTQSKFILSAELDSFELGPHLDSISKVTQTDWVGEVIRTSSGQTAVDEVIGGLVTAAVVWTSTVPHW